jgi:U3 small nucleolar RNA-associated protein 22
VPLANRRGQISEATSKFEKKHRIVVPYPDPRPAKDAPYKLAFEKPALCNVVGSYVSRTMVKTQTRFCVDMVVQMPKSMFQEKDFQNLRYFYRRAYYIAYIAAHVRKEVGASMDLSFEFLHDNRLLPVLVLQPRAGADDNATENGTYGKKKNKKKEDEAGKAGYSVRIIPCAPEDLFPSPKLTPTSNANRAAEVDEKKASSAATPFYNSTLKAESTFISYLRIVTKAKSDCPSFADACLLGRTWLQQRGFGGAISQGGFGHFEFAVMVALLLQTGGRKGQAALSSSLSNTELFKAAIQFLADIDFNKKPLVLGKTTTGIDRIRESGPVMYDPATNLNLLYKMTPWSASFLHLQAKSTSDLLADEAADKFGPIFIVRANILSQIYDAIFEVNSPDVSHTSGSPDHRGALLDYSAETYKILKKAYGNRAELVHLQQPSTTPWSLGASHPAESGTLLVGVIFNFPHMSRQMEHGPPAEEQKEAARFRQFWGEKAELRRFKDGSILECVEWSGRQAFDICEELSRYALRRHLKLTKDEIEFHGQEYSSIVTFSHVDKAAFDGARRSFQTFEHDVRSLDDLPLQIRQLAPVSPLSRYSSIQPPLLGAHTSSINPMDVNLYFEASSKWPENLVAIQEAKIEFLLDIDRRLTGAHDNITTCLGRENRDIGTENLTYLDIVYENTGAAFRVRIFCDLEETMLDRQVKNRTLEPYMRDDAEEALARFRWQYTTLPLHTQTIATFCTRLPALSETIRLIKQWFSSHKLVGHISEELIELLCLHVFLCPYPWKVPSSVTTGFLRTLDFLSRWDWRDEPLIIDSAETLTNDDRTSIRKHLEEWRKRDPNMNHAVLFVATSHDRSGTAYTRDGPSKLIASRMTRLAKAACKLVKQHDYLLDPADLFETSLNDYDILVHLSPKAARAVMRAAANETGGARKASHLQFKNLDDRIGKIPLPVRAHPVDVLLGELQRVYDEELIFFRGGNSGDVDDGDAVIGAIWNPKLRRQKFRAGLPYNFARVAAEKQDEEDEEGDFVEVNRRAVLLEMARIGGDMIKKIEEVEE